MMLWHYDLIMTLWRRYDMTLWHDVMRSWCHHDVIMTMWRHRSMCSYILESSASFCALPIYKGSSAELNTHTHTSAHTHTHRHTHIHTHTHTHTHIPITSSEERGSSIQQSACSYWPPVVAAGRRLLFDMIVVDQVSNLTCLFNNVS